MDGIYQPELERLWEQSRVAPLNMRWVGYEHVETEMNNLKNRLLKIGDDLIGELFLQFDIDEFLDQGCQHGEGNECPPDDPDCEVCCLQAALDAWHNTGQKKEA